MSVLDARKTYNNLMKKGFVESKNMSDDHKYIALYHNGKYVCSTKISHGEKDIKPYLIRQMADQCNLSKFEFLKLAKCPLSKEEYLSILDSKGLLK